MTLRLNVGCGSAVLENWINADIHGGPGVDLIFDAQGRWPLPTASVSEVRAWSVLEHLPRWEAAVMEAARVLRPRGRLDVRVPAGLRILTEPYHVRAFTTRSLDLFLDGQRVRLLDGRTETNPRATTGEPVRRLFRRRSVRVLHWYPCSWHAARYLGEWAYALPLSRRRTIAYDLERTEEPWGPALEEIAGMYDW